MSAASLFALDGRGEMSIAIGVGHGIVASGQHHLVADISR
jgi:hypothetical protein